MFAAVDSAELSRWYARWSRIGFSDWRQAGMIAATVATAELKQVFEPQRFMETIKEDAAARQQGADEQKELAAIVHASLGV